MRNLKEYFRPDSPAEAVALKRRYGDRAVYLAGGSDLMVHHPAAVEAAIDTRFAGIGYAREEDSDYVIGGACLLRDAEREVGHVAGGMLGRALFDTAPWLIRNVATVAGNIANASPSADSVPALLALDADLILLGDSTERVPLQSVLQGSHRTSLGDRLITEIRVPRAASERPGVFIKLARSESDLAQVNVAVTLRLDGDVLRDVRIALGSVAPTAFRARDAESMVEGKPLGGELLKEIESAVQAEVRPITDWRASADYRRRVSGVLVRRALERAAGMSGNGAST